MRIYRLTLDGKKWPPAKENGKFVLADPRHGNMKHHADKQVHVSSEDAAIDLIKSGFSVRVETTSRPSLVRRNLFVDGVQVS